MNAAKLRRTFISCFRPPFEGLPVLVWIYFALCFLLYPGSNILHGQFVDSDDYTILSHTLDWLKGQGWFDIVQYRMNAPFGVPLHFSRLNELPLGGLITTFHTLGFGWIAAATLTAALWPLLLFAVLLAALPKLAESFLPRDWTRASAFVILFALPVTIQFMPGRADHHGLALLLTLLAYINAVRMMEQPEATKWGLGAGFFLALAQAFALETLPWLLVMASGVGLWMMNKGRVAARTGLAFGLTLYAASAVFLMTTLPPGQWLQPHILAYSVAYVLLANAIAVCCAAVALAAQTRFAALRYAAGIGSFLVTAFSFFLLFPELLAGPYGAIDKNLGQTMFGEISEMLPLIKQAHPVTIMIVLMGGLFAYIGLFPALTDKDKWQKWSLSFLLFITAFLLTSFYQIRFVSYASLFSIVPLTLFLQRSLTWANKRWRGRKLAAVEFGLILLVGPLLTVLFPALVDGRSFNKGVLLFPVEYAQNKCNSLVVANKLNDQTLFGSKPGLMINTPNEGAALLFFTHHMILAAPYHTNVSGTLDTDRFFAAVNPAEAEKIARERHADLVVVCRTLPFSYRSKQTRKFWPNGENLNDAIGEASLTPDATFAEQLIAGKIPAWLEPVKLPRSSNTLIFKIKP